MNGSGRWAAASVCALLVLNGTAAAEPLRVVDLLDPYAKGSFHQVVQALDATDSFEPFLEELKRDAPAWIEAGGPADRDRRRLTAATLALEASRSGLDREWKRLWTFRVQMPNLEYIVHDLTWQPPALLLEWGCALMRANPPPPPLDRTWHHAALAVAARAQDFELLLGHPAPPRDSYTADPIFHASHMRERDPNAKRPSLVEAASLERQFSAMSEKLLEPLAGDPDMGGEATMRLGALAMRRRQDDRALALFKQAETLTRDPWVVYLARFFTAQVHDRRNRRADAERVYRAALATMPGAQSAATGLAALLVRENRRREAEDIIARMLALQPATDPWRTYGDGDDRFWPELVAKIRAEIHR